ncbi:MAG: Sulfate transporter CysZ [Flavobacterium sp. SCGC AAA160-P02]|nr:MAG: Sulfate transporter CysZ [Flavobacterium sp. SCGC AAA160-P02]
MIKGITTGIKAYFEAYKILSRLRLWKYFVIPVVLCVIIFFIIGFLSYFLSGNIGNYIASFWFANFWPWDHGKDTIHNISNMLGALIVIVIGFIAFKHLVMALSAPFIGPISKIIEDDFTGVVSDKENSSFLKLLLRGVRIALRNFAKELFLTLPILLFGLIPVIGLFSTVLLFLLQSYFAGFGNMDPTLERHLTYKESILFVQKNKGLALGNGVVFVLFLLLPFLGVLLVLPFSVTAATIATVKLIHKEH